MTEVYSLHSEQGDEYKLQFTTERSGIIADDILDQLNAQGIEVVEIGPSFSTSSTTDNTCIMPR